MNVERAVRLLAGTMVGISLLGWLLHSPHWLWLAGFVSLNLIQSSFTGICPAEWVLGWMGLRSCSPPSGEQLSSSMDPTGA